MRTFVVRHAKAGDREKWTRPDVLRPLTKAGWEQAEALVSLLAGEEIGRVASSPYVRCVETVEPIGRERGLPVLTSCSLSEEASVGQVLELITALGDGAVCCTHGNVMEDLIAHLASEGIPGADPTLAKKGATWVLVGAPSSGGTAFASAAYLPPPA